MTLADHEWGVSPGADRIWAEVAGLRPSAAAGRKMMVLQAYIDDSRDDASGVYVLAGYISSAERWAAFSREWEKLLPFGTLNERGHYHFKMSDMAQSPERMSRVPAFHTVINEHAMMSFACVIDRPTIERAKERVRKLLPWNAQVLYPPGEFLMCFYFLMNTFHMNVVGKPGPVNVNEPVDFYFDDTTEKWRVVEAWDFYIKNVVPDVDREKYGTMPRFVPDELYLPVQAADFRAWWVRKWAMDLGVANAHEGRVPYRSAAKAIPHITIHVTEEQLFQFIVEGLERVEES